MEEGVTKLTIIGNNSITLNSATMMQLVEDVLNNSFYNSKPPMKVSGIRYNAADATFDVKIEPKPEDNA